MCRVEKVLRRLSSDVCQLASDLGRLDEDLFLSAMDRGESAMDLFQMAKDLFIESKDLLALDAAGDVLGPAGREESLRILRMRHLAFSSVMPRPIASSS